MVAFYEEIQKNCSSSGIYQQTRSFVTKTALKKWHANFKQYLVAEGAVDILEDPESIINADKFGCQTTPCSS